MFVVAAAALLAATACSLRRHLPGAPAAAATEAAAEDQTQPSPAATPAPGAKIQILYTHRDDYLSTLTVTKYSGATIIRVRPSHNGQVSVVRFQGGEPVWKIEVNRGFTPLLSPLPGLDANKKFAPTEVTYGTLPQHFIKDLPALGDPEPLQPGFYYVFSVERAVGQSSYQAVYVTPEGAIEGYDAQPLIGTSYELCCSISPDFAGSTPAVDQAAPDPGP
jgi:hypothetical protein